MPSVLQHAGAKRQRAHGSEASEPSERRRAYCNTQARSGRGHTVARRASPASDAERTVTRRREAVERTSLSERATPRVTESERALASERTSPWQQRLLFPTHAARPQRRVRQDGSGGRHNIWCVLRSAGRMAACNSRFARLVIGLGWLSGVAMALFWLVLVGSYGGICGDRRSWGTTAIFAFWGGVLGGISGGLC